MTEYERCVASFKENLPAKSVRYDCPRFLWIQAPMHDNFQNNPECFKFNKALEETVKLHSNMYTLMLKKVWDPKDKDLFLESQQFSAVGFRYYWEAVDKTIRYFHSVVLRKTEKWAKSQNNVSKYDQNNFRRQNPQLNHMHTSVERVYKKLPPPP